MTADKMIYLQRKTYKMRGDKVRKWLKELRENEKMSQQQMSEDDIKEHYVFLNRFCTANNYENYIFGDVSSVGTLNDLNVENVYDNHGIIGHTHAPVTIINGGERALTEQETVLLDIFKKLNVIKQAQLLAYAAELEKEV